MTRITGPDCAIMCNVIYLHTHTHTDQYEWHRLTRMTWSDCAICNLINTHNLSTIGPLIPFERINASGIE